MTCPTPPAPMTENFNANAVRPYGRPVDNEFVSWMKIAVELLSLTRL